MEYPDASSKLTTQLTQLRNDARELHETTLLQLQVNAAAKIDGELKQRISFFTKEVDEKKAKAALYVLQLFNRKTREIGNQTSSPIMDCLQFSTDGCAEPEEHALLSNDAKLAELSTKFLDLVNAFYCHKVESLVLNPNSSQNANLIADEHSKGQLHWSEEMVKAAAEWTDRGIRLRGLHGECGSKAQSHEQNIVSYVDDQLEVAFTLMCVELKADILKIIADARVDSLRIRELAMSEFLKVMKQIKMVVQRIDSLVGSDVAALRTASYVINQARKQEKAFACTMTAACDLYVANIITAARICIMREVESRSYSGGRLKDLLVALLDDIK